MRDTRRERSGLRYSKNFSWRWLPVSGFSPRWADALSRMQRFLQKKKKNSKLRDLSWTNTRAYAASTHSNLRVWLYYIFTQRSKNRWNINLSRCNCLNTYSIFLLGWCENTYYVSIDQVSHFLSTYVLLENYTFVNLLIRQNGKITLGKLLKFGITTKINNAEREYFLYPLHEYKFSRKAKLVLENYFLKLGIRRKQNVHECKFTEKRKRQNYILKITCQNLESNIKREYLSAS